MARASLIQNALNGGELSALMLGRQDVDKYVSGLFVCLNGLTLAQGPWTRRPGTAYLHQVKHHDKRVRLFPFQYSVTQTYVLEFGEGYIRFFTDHGILVASTQSITSISKANPGQVTKTSHGYSNGDRLYLSDVEGMTQLSGREVVVAGATANEFNLTDSDGLNINTTGYDTFVSGNMSEILEVPTAFSEADLPDIRITQSADTLFILHPDHPPQKLVRVAATSWTLSDLDFTDGPYDIINGTSTTLSPSAATGTVTITASAVTGINLDTGFKATDVGRLIRLREGSTWGYCRVLTHTSSVAVTAAVLSTLTNTNAKTGWRLGVWSDTTGFPAVGTFYEDRLWLAGAALYPQRLDGSKTGIYTNFSPSATDGTVANDNAVSYVLNADDVNAVKWLAASEKGLLAGTSRGEWQVKASSLNEGITPTNISAKPSTRHGSADVAPVSSGRVVLFVQRAGRKLREMAYVFEVDGFRAPDMTLLSEHITRPSLDELAYQEQPQNVMWGVRGDGVLLGFTYERDQNVTAWHRHELGGFSDVDQTLIPVVESIATVTAPDATRDELYLAVQRYINGQERRYIEYMSKIWEVEDEQEDAFHLDCGWTQFSSQAEYLSLPGTTGNYASTPDSAASSVTGDLDIRARIAPDTWVPGSENYAVVSKWTETGNQRSYILMLQVTTGKIVLFCSSDGVNVTVSGIGSVAPAPFANGSAHWIRATLDVDDGAGNHVVQFFTSENGISWTLVDTVTTAGVTSVFNSTAVLEIGSHGAGTDPSFNGRIYSAQVRNGIGGTIVADFNANDGKTGATSFLSRETGEIWTINTSGSPTAALVGTAPTDLVTGLYHLEGETVSVYVDGMSHPERTVTNGKIELNGTYSLATLGYSYNSDGQTLPLEGGSQDGSSQTKIRRITRVGFWLVDTLGLKYGMDADNLTEVPFRQWGDEMGVATPLFTGVKRVRFEGDYDRLGQVYWRADGPFPATVAAVAPQFEVADDS